MKVGCDIIKISRFEDNLSAFSAKYLTEKEREYLAEKDNKAQTLAGFFSAKEAVLKAFGNGICNGISLSDIEITHEESGRPIVKVKNFKGNIDISISHDGEYAMAVCIIE